MLGPGLEQPVDSKQERSLQASACLPVTLRSNPGVLWPRPASPNLGAGAAGRGMARGGRHGGFEARHHPSTNAAAREGGIADQHERVVLASVSPAKP